MNLMPPESDQKTNPATGAHRRAYLAEIRKRDRWAQHEAISDGERA